MSIDDLAKWMNLRDAAVPGMSRLQVAIWMAKTRQVDEDFCTTCLECPMSLHGCEDRVCWIATVATCLQAAWDHTQAKEFCTSVIELMAQ